MCYSGDNRGFAYVIYRNQNSIDKIINNINKQFHWNGTKMFATTSRNLRKLIIKNIPKNLDNEYILKIAINYSQPKRLYFEFCEDQKCVVLEFSTHREAALFRRSLICEISCFGPHARVCWLKSNN